MKARRIRTLNLMTMNIHSHAALQQYDGEASLSINYVAAQHKLSVLSQRVIGRGASARSHIASWRVLQNLVAPATRLAFAGGGYAIGIEII